MCDRDVIKKKIISLNRGGGGGGERREWKTRKAAKLRNDEVMIT